MDTRKQTIRRLVQSRPVVVLELNDEDFELVDELPSWRARRYPPAISDGELSRLVEECTAEICLHAYDLRYGSYAHAVS